MKHSAVRGRLLESLAAISIAFFGFWGISLLAIAIAGRPAYEAFPHKLFVLFATTVLQAGMAFSHPVRRGVHLWLRLCTVAGGIILYGAAFLIEIAALKLIDPDTLHLGMTLTVLFAVGVSVSLLPALKKNISSFGS